MDLYLHDTDLSASSIIDDYTSLVWSERFQEPGDFELHLKTTSWALSDFETGKYLSKTDSNDVMIIESREISNDSEEGSEYVVKGRSLSSILDRRVNISKYAYIKSSKYSTDDEDNVFSYSGDIAQILRDIITDEFIDPKVSTYIEYEAGAPTTGGITGDAPSADYTNRNDPKEEPAPERKIANLKLGDFGDTGIEITRECTNIENVLDLVEELCKQAQVGFNISLDYETKDFTFYIYEGADRTLSQYDRQPLYFSQEMSNIIYTNYYEDVSTYKNTVYALGSSGKADFGKHGYVQHVNVDDAAADPTNVIYPGYSEVYLDETGQVTGLERRECMYEVSDATLEDSDKNGSDYGDDSSETGGSDWISDQCMPYIDTIIAGGKNHLKDDDVAKVTEANGEIDLKVMYQYGIDYFMGDKVEFDTGFGVSVISYVDEVVYSYGTDGIIVTPNFKKLEEDE